MKKLLASLLVLAMCAPAMAVTFSTSAGPAGSGLLNINYSLAAGEGIRGLALTLNVTGGNGQIVDGTTGHAFGPFNTFVDYAFSNSTGYTVGAGHPFANVSAAGVATFPTSNCSLCLGFLDTLGAQAAVTTSGTITVKFTGTTTTTVAVALDTLRGGVVGDGLAATAGLPASQALVFATETIPGTPVVAKTTAAPAVADKVNGGRVETFVASGVASSLGHALEYQFTWGDGTTSAWGPATQTKTYTYGGAGVVKLTPDTFNVTVQARCAADTTVVSAVSAPLALTSEPVKSTATFYAAWAQFGRKDCWAYPRNCNGDVDGLKQGSVVLGYTWVSTNDLTTFLGAYNVKEPTKGIGIMNIPGHPNAICADFDHAQQGSVVLGYTRVSTNDLTIFLASYNDKEPTKGPGVPVCAQTNYHYWTKSPL